VGGAEEDEKNKERRTSSTQNITLRLVVKVNFGSIEDLSLHEVMIVYTRNHDVETVVVFPFHLSTGHGECETECRHTLRKEPVETYRLASLNALEYNSQISDLGLLFTHLAQTMMACRKRFGCMTSPNFSSCCEIFENLQASSSRVK
jgi:hypothetical protein